MALRDVDVPRVLERLGIATKPQGRELWARCPFHEERSPSWRIRNDPSHDHHAVWQCFGSCPEGERSGSIVALVLRLLDLPSRDDAWRWIKEKDGERQARPAIRVEVVVAERPGAFVLPAGVRIAPVAEWVTPARRYLLDERGVPAEQAERWGLGCAVEGKLAGRIVIPIRDGAGALKGYTARTYLGNPQRFKAANKEDGADVAAVFGEQHWPRSDRRVVVAIEAAFDGLGVEWVSGLPIGGIFGSELLPGHVARLSTFETILVASDPDEAGDKLFDAIRRHLGRRHAVRRVEIPDGTDCAALAKAEPERLADAIRRAACVPP